jgi:hypothetical protein
LRRDWLARRRVEVVGLRRAELGQLDAELVEVEGGDLFVEVLE